MNVQTREGEPGEAIEDPVFNTRFNRRYLGGVYPWKDNIGGHRLLSHTWFDIGNKWSVYRPGIFYGRQTKFVAAGRAMID